MQRKPIDAAGREKLKNIKGPLKGAMPPHFNKTHALECR